MKTLSILSLMLLPAATTVAGAANPLDNLTADVKGHQVVLSWDHPEANHSNCLSHNDFETLFPGEGWEVKSLNTRQEGLSLYSSTWFHYPDDKFKELKNWQHMVGNGEMSALVFYDLLQDMEGHSPEQDEWLISPPLANPRYLSFITYINPMVMTYGEDEEFDEHYQVLVSDDDGDTWTTLWDAPRDGNGADGWQAVALYIGNRGDRCRVAFRAISMPGQSLHFAWGLDDIRFHNGTDGDDPATVAFNVYLDGILLAENVRATTYTDRSDKTPGAHTYTVVPVNERGDETPDRAADLEVILDEIGFNPPTNVTTEVVWNDIYQAWEVLLKWDAPEGDFQPSYYNTYECGIQFGFEITDHEIGEFGLPRGVYEYGVEAVYTHPDGKSEVVTRVAAVDTPYPPVNFTAEVKGRDVILAWESQDAADDGVKYDLYRGNTLIAEGTEKNFFTDINAPNGFHTYAVVARYPSGDASLATKAVAQVGLEKLYQAPYQETFDGTNTPADWDVLTTDDWTPPYYQWRFDNWYGIDMAGAERFSGNFASAQSEVSGFVYVGTMLVTPTFDFSGLDAEEPIYVSFDIDYLSEPDAEAEAILAYSTDGGENWEMIREFTPYFPGDLEEGMNTCPEHISVMVNDLVAGYYVKFGITYDAMLDHHLCLDNFAVSNDSAHAESLAVGHREVREVRYYDAHGTRLDAPRHGQFVVREYIFTNGQRAIIKEIAR